MGKSHQLSQELWPLIDVILFSYIELIFRGGLSCLPAALLFENYLLMLPWQPIKLSNSNKSLMKCGELFNKHFCKNKILLTPMRR